MSGSDHVRVWDMQDLNILDGLDNPVSVHIYGLFENQHWYVSNLKTYPWTVFLLLGMLYAQHSICVI